MSNFKQIDILTPNTSGAQQWRVEAVYESGVVRAKRLATLDGETKEYMVREMAFTYAVEHGDIPVYLDNGKKIKELPRNKPEFSISVSMAPRYRLKMTIAAESPRMFLPEPPMTNVLIEGTEESLAQLAAAVLGRYSINSGNVVVAVKRISPATVIPHEVMFTTIE